MDVCGGDSCGYAEVVYSSLCFQGPKGLSKRNIYDWVARGQRKGRGWEIARDTTQQTENEGRQVNGSKQKRKWQHPLRIEATTHTLESTMKSKIHTKDAEIQFFFLDSYSSFLVSFGTNVKRMSRVALQDPRNQKIDW